MSTPEEKLLWDIFGKPAVEAAAVLLARVLTEHHLATRPGRGCVWIMACACGFDTPLIEEWAKHAAEAYEVETTL